MSNTKQKAIALCRVSSDEQLKNNSLNRQNESVRKIAEEYNLEIIKIWSGSMSSRCGKNLNRKDLKEMLAFCKANKQVKFLVIHEPDRFMRSIDEAFYFEVRFKELGVKVLYSDPELNSDSLASKMQRFLKYFVAEGANEKRINSSIDGHEKAISEGRYPFVPKLGYKKGVLPGVAEIDPVVGPLLRDQLVRIADRLASPSVALQDYNDSIKRARLKKAPLKMDKWRSICTDSYYCGVVEIHKVVDASNPNGLHKRLITKEQHEKILEVFNGKPKNQRGPNTSGNPLYPFNRMVIHEGCPCNKSRYNTFVGVTVKNSRGREYEKYRCRGCYMSISREEMRKRIEGILSSIRLTEPGEKALRKALIDVFNAEAGDRAERKARLYSQRVNVEKKSRQLSDAYREEPEGRIKDDLRKQYYEALADMDRYTEEIDKLEDSEDSEYESFVSFAFDFVRDLVHNVLNLPPHKMQLCKQLLFPDGFFVDENKNVYTQNISPIYRLCSTKKGSYEPSNSIMVRMKRL